jgi:hypothetical protein
VKPCHVTVSKVYSNSCIKLQLISFVKNRTLLRQGVCVTHLHWCKTSDIIFDLAGVCKAWRLVLHIL